MNDWEKMEYEQASEDWRHRDQLTWQIPAVVIAVGGFILAEAFKVETPIWLRCALLIFASTLTFALSVALSQNLSLQQKGRIIIQSLYSETKRFQFGKWGSILFEILCWATCLFLGLLCGLSFTGKL